MNKKMICFKGATILGSEGGVEDILKKYCESDFPKNKYFV